MPFAAVRVRAGTQCIPRLEREGCLCGRDRAARGTDERGWAAERRCEPRPELRAGEYAAQIPVVDDLGDALDRRCRIERNVAGAGAERAPHADDRRERLLHVNADTGARARTV